MTDPVNYCSWFANSFCISQSEWAAWTQAVMSVIAIVAAARIATAAERRAISRRVDIVVGLIGRADYVALFAMVLYPKKHRIYGSGDYEQGSLDNVRQEIGRLSESLREVQMHDLPAKELIPFVLRAQKICEEITDSIDSPVSERTEAEAFQSTIRRRSDELHQIYGQIFELGQRYKQWYGAKVFARFIHWLEVRNYRRHAASTK